MNLDLAGNDIRLGSFDSLLDIVGHQFGVVLVDRIVNAAFLDAENIDAGGKLAIRGILEGIVGRDVDPLEHRGQNLARMQAVLIGINADCQFVSVGSRLQNSDARAAGSREDDVGTLVDL